MDKELIIHPYKEKYQIDNPDSRLSRLRLKLYNLQVYLVNLENRILKKNYFIDFNSLDELFQNLYQFETYFPKNGFNFWFRSPPPPSSRYYTMHLSNVVFLESIGDDREKDVTLLDFHRSVEFKARRREYLPKGICRGDSPEWILDYKMKSLDEISWKQLGSLMPLDNIEILFKYEGGKFYLTDIRKDRPINPEHPIKTPPLADLVNV